MDRTNALIGGAFTIFSTKESNVNWSFKKSGVLGLVIWLQLVGGTALAATIVVDTALDVVAEDGFCSLREAIINANTNSQSGSTECAGGDSASNTIVFDPSLANATITLNDGQLPTISRTLIIEGPVAGDPTGLTLDGNLSSRLIMVVGAGEVSSPVILRNLKLTGGRTTGTGLANGGGAISAAYSHLLLENVLISDNSTSGNSASGGGLLVQMAQVELIDSVVEHNRTEGLSASGGGIHVRGGELTLLRVRVDSNSTEGNSANGGGISAAASGEDGSVVSIADSVIVNNQTRLDATTFGGGLDARSSQVTINRTTISDNQTQASGGGLFIGEGDMDLVNSTVSGNRGNATGGIQLNRSTATLLHSTIAFNWASSVSSRDLGLFGQPASPAAVGLVNSLVVQAESGLASCSGNDYSTFVNLGSFSTHEACTGVATSPEDIHLGPLADRGGLSPTHSLFPGSVAIGAGGDCTADYGIAVDQRGEPRPGGDSTVCDVGAFELQQAPPETDLAIAKSVNPDAANVNDSLTFTISVRNYGPDDATGVAVSDKLPAGYIFDSATASMGSYDEDSGLWNIGPLAATSSASLAIEVTVGGIDDYVNVATVTGNEFDPDHDNNSAQAVPDIVPLQVDLAITKDVSPAVAAIDDPVTFTLVASNLGPDDASGVEVLDQLPFGYAFVEATAESGTYDENSGYWSIGTLEADSQVVLTIEATVTGFNDYHNIATISGDQQDPDPTNNSDTALITLPPQPEAIMVNTLADVVADDEMCSLREAIINAVNSDQSGSEDCEVSDTIRFDESLIGGAIELNGTQLPTISEDLIIEGPVAGDPAGLTLDGQGLSRIFNIDNEVYVTISDLTLTGGHTTEPGIHGGAIRIVEDSSVELVRVHLHDNVTTSASGGAIFVHFSVLSLIDSDLSDNQAPGTAGRGGAIEAQDSSIEMRGTTLAGNGAGSHGGGLHLTRSPLTATNSTLSGNTAGGSGGAIKLDRSSAELSHVTVALNSASGGGSGIFVAATSANPVELSMINSLAVENHCHVSGGANYTLFSSGSLSTAAGCVEGSATPAELINLLPLADNGGPTRTHALGMDSVAVGFVGNCGEELDIDTDQRGEQRPGAPSTACDAGAYEFQGNNEDRIHGDRFEDSQP